MFQSTRGSVDSMPITPPHPPKRPRTSRQMAVRRSRSLGSQDRERDRITAQLGGGKSNNLNREQSIERRQITSAGEMQSRPKERIEVRFFFL